MKIRASFILHTILESIVLQSKTARRVTSDAEIRSLHTETNPSTFRAEDASGRYGCPVSLGGVIVSRSRWSSYTELDG
jgi:hypothetical protein